MGRLIGVILAAGHSSRTGKANKLIQPISGHPMVWYPVHNMQAVRLDDIRIHGLDKIFVVLGHQQNEVQSAIGNDIAYTPITQRRRLGTAHALLQVVAEVGDTDTVVVLYGDCPFFFDNIIGGAIKEHLRSSADLTIATAKLPEKKTFGRVRLINEQVVGIDEVDVVPEHTSMNTGIEADYDGPVFGGLSIWRGSVLRSFLRKVPLRRKSRTVNCKEQTRKEKDLTAIVEILHAAGKKVIAYEVESKYALGPNDIDDINEASAFMNQLRIGWHARNGVIVDSPQTVLIDYDVRIGAGTRILSGTALRGATMIGVKCTIGPNCLLNNCTVHDNCIIETGAWNQTQAFEKGSRVIDRLAQNPKYRLFKSPHFMIPEEPDRYFVIIPFRGIYMLLFYHILKPTLDRMQLRCEPLFEPHEPEIVFDRIWTEINRSWLILADITEDNPNVWYELGLAHAMCKPVILLWNTAIRKKLPFDISSINHLQYSSECFTDKDIRGLQDDLYAIVERLQAAKHVE